MLPMMTKPLEASIPNIMSTTTTTVLALLGIQAARAHDVTKTDLDYFYQEQVEQIDVDRTSLREIQAEQTDSDVQWWMAVVESWCFL